MRMLGGVFLQLHMSQVDNNFDKQNSCFQQI